MISIIVPRPCILVEKVSAMGKERLREQEKRWRRDGGHEGGHEGGKGDMKTGRQGGRRVDREDMHKNMKPSLSKKSSKCY